MDTSRSKRIKLLFFVITLALVALAWFIQFRRMFEPPGREPLRLNGHSMGTSYSIIYYPGPQTPAREAVQEAVEHELQRINKLFSAYDAQSELSRVNAHESPEPFEASKEFAGVLRLSLRVAEASGGAFDPTVAPLVNLWGFGPQGKRTVPPDEADLDRMRPLVGWQHITLDGQQITKSLPGLTLDFGGIAKGYGVDRVSAVLRALGSRDHLVEIGGETRMSGAKPDGSLWRIGVQKPGYHAVAGDELVDVLEASDLSVATSGDYQHFRTTDDGQVFAHIIDPRTGHPARHATASVTVLAADCATADAWATALYVLGPDEGFEHLEQQPDLGVMFIVRGPDGEFTRRSNARYKRLVKSEF